MAVVVTENFDARMSQSSLRDSQYTRQQVRSFIVVVDSQADAPIAARTATGIPSIGNVHPDDGAAQVVNVIARPRAGDWRTYDVVVTYECGRYHEVGVSISEPSGSPLDDPPDYEWSFIASTQTIAFDRDQNPIVNAAGEPFDPPLEIVVYRPALRVTRIQTTFQASVAVAYVGAINNDQFAVAGSIVSPEEAKMTDIRGRNWNHGGVSYWRVTYALEFNQGFWMNEEWTHWDPVILNQGYRYWTDDEPPELVTPPDRDGRSLGKPSLLNENGRLLDVSGGPGTYQATYIRFPVHKTMPFYPIFGSRDAISLPWP